MAYKYPSDADLNAHLKKSESKTQIPKQNKKNTKGHSRSRPQQKPKSRKSQGLSTRKEFVTIDVDAFRLTDRELQQRTENRKSKNQVLGQLEAYNRTIPVHSRIPPEITDQLLKEKVNSKTNIFDFETVMARADEVLRESRDLLNDAPASQWTLAKLTEPSSFKGAGIMNTCRDHKSLTSDSHIICLKPVGYAEDFPKESHMDIHQGVIPTDNEWTRFRTAPSRYIPRFATEEEPDDEPNVRLTLSEASCGRPKMKEYLKKLQKFRD